MSDDTEGTAVITTDQIFNEVRALGAALTELRVEFKSLAKLEARVDKLEERERAAWQLPVAWTSAVAGGIAAVYQAFNPGK